MRTAYLRVYQPLKEFPPDEHERWGEHRLPEDAVDRLRRRWLILGTIPSIDHVSDGAFVREIDGAVYVCPWRTRLRMLSSLLAFRGSVPSEIADLFVPEDEAVRAADELRALERARPDMRSHILHANWHVPLRWFAAFADADRILTEDREGLRIRYEATLESCRSRLDRAIAILERAWIDEEITAAVRELAAWLSEFSGECLLELDYGTVARVFDDDDLVDDRSAEQVWTCLDALAGGDTAAATRTFGDLTDRWGDVRAHEILN